ncbi:sarcosine oxidase subunit gamma [Thioalkalivibrio sp. HK1]|uniref:sarcosine oxidase subunit gamma n=1 Tax=Thioalkalivibrio sp. HK1 TaxID=1469245 RepID=UPI0004709815|nr:sarcosine oxidase subunit gamma family protein [Thioalkalivibrio sp. HK1]
MPAADNFRYQSALDALNLANRAKDHTSAADESEGDLDLDLDRKVILGERPPRGLLNLRGDADDAKFKKAVQTVLKIEPITEPLTSQSKGDRQMLWLGPDEWLIAVPEEKLEETEEALRKKLEDLPFSLCDISHARTIIGIGGPKAIDVIAKGCPLDLHPTEFPTGHCAQSRLARCNILIHRIDDDPTFEIHVARSFALYAWQWLEDGAKEFEMQILLQA